MPKKITAMAAAAVALAAWNGVARASEGGAESEAPLLVPLEPMRMPIIDHGELLGRLEVRVMWRATGESDLAAAEQALPLLRAALVEGVGEHARLEATPSHAVDPKSLIKRLDRAASRAGFKGEALLLEAVSR